MSDCKAFMEFCERVGNDTAIGFLEELCDLAWSGTKKSVRITISDRHAHDAINHTYFGTLTHEGTEYSFVIDNGNWNGTVVREWGSADDIGTYEPPKTTVYTFVPTNGTLKEDSAAMWAVYLHWRKQPWFQDKERGYNYDRHFAPGGKTESYYRDWAATKGLKIVTEDEATEIVKRPEQRRWACEQQESEWAQQQDEYYQLRQEEKDYYAELEAQEMFWAEQAALMDAP